MMDRAYALISGNRRKKLKVTLRPKLSRKSADLSALKGAFLAELEAQKLRWAVARNNASVREYVAENALSLAKEYSERTASSSAPAVEELTEAQRSEIERLIEEVETEIAEMNLKKAPESNPAALSWEAAQKPATGGAGA